MLAILFFGLIIFIHELGHFLSAKWAGVKVNEFAMGMGPTLFKFGKKETTYALRLFPIGGFVSMEGEDEESSDDRAVNRKPPWKRAIIMAAGAIMNLILGLVIVGIWLAITGMGSTTVSKFDAKAVSNAEGGLQIGDKIIGINGMHVYDYFDIPVGMSRDTDGSIDFTVKRGGQKVDLPNVQFATQDVNGTTMIVHDFFVQPLKTNPFSLIKQSVLYSVSIGRLIWLSLFDIISGRYGVSELSGPIGTVAVVGKAASVSLDSFLMLAAFITINVGIFNLLPIPALDGGRLLFLLIEVIRRKPISPKYEGYVHAAGFALLILFMVFVSFNDIRNLILGRI